jgi:hypothetical protein
LCSTESGLYRRGSKLCCFKCIKKLKLLVKVF